MTPHNKSLALVLDLLKVNDLTENNAVTVAQLVGTVTCIVHKHFQLFKNILGLFV